VKSFEHCGHTLLTVHFLQLLTFLTKISNFDSTKGAWHALLPDYLWPSLDLNQKVRIFCSPQVEAGPKPISGDSWRELRLHKDAQGCTRMHKGYFPGCQGIGVTRLWRLRAESSNLSCQDFREDVETTNQELRVHGEIGSFIASWAEVFIIIGQQFWGEFEICSKNQAALGVFLQRIGPRKQEFLILQGITSYIITFFRLMRPTDSWFSNRMIPCGPVFLFILMASWIEDSVFGELEGPRWPGHSRALSRSLKPDGW
jgi:hypothetical protein